jgi:hypothetical protein
MERGISRERNRVKVRVSSCGFVEIFDFFWLSLSLSKTLRAKKCETFSL